MEGVIKRWEETKTKKGINRLTVRLPEEIEEDKIRNKIREKEMERRGKEVMEWKEEKEKITTMEREIETRKKKKVYYCSEKNDDFGVIIYSHQI